jgi:hypothetical protein
MTLAGQGYDGFMPSDLVLPRLRIQQPTSKGEARPGTFVDALTGQEHGELRVTFLRVTRGRVLWVEGFDEPQCKSRDGRVPDPRVEHPPSDRCTAEHAGRLKPVCPQAQWGPNDQKPACHETMTLLGINVADGAPFLLAVHGSALKSARKFISAVALRRRNLRDASITLRLSACDGRQGKYYVPVFADLKWNEPGAFDEPYATYARYDEEATYDAERAAGTNTDFDFGANAGT